MIRRSPTGWTEAMRVGKPYPIKALIACNNPMSNWPGQTAAREAFAALELLVHIELFANETSAFADYVLPTATGIEKRSEEHTSELQSLMRISYAVFCLKKKK